MPITDAKNLNTIRAAFMRRASAPHVNALALKLAYLIAFKFMDSATGTARPSQDTLARDLAVSVRTVQRLLDLLIPLGLVIVPGHGPGRAATYWIDPDKATPVSPINTTPVSPIGGRKGDNRRQNTRHPATKYTTPVSPPLKKNLQEEEPREEYISEPPDFAAPDSKGDARSKGEPKASETHDDKKNGVKDFAPTFPEFWLAYPKRVAKAQAEKAFAAAIRRGADPAALIDGAKRYANERARQDPKFTKHPATWINAECWLDQSFSHDGKTIDQHGNIIDTPRPRRRSQEEIDAEAEAQILADNAHWSSRR
ncbi:helix-turn-helix domain-containing protein [Bradyrhizobium sp. CSS354]|uniref:helix-turn-helix domain-containing protein n=1 Tax=Bradyrhizobium sp. CSS354 TaxID=2699172 RepID=UPI0023B0C422|nr:helix-turn-helix domain-containing protein [Bradyrhizobium sp. CSS354]MDE5461151.1 hypothetical protein [Bradyrhizobium sp. CSS354]